MCICAEPEARRVPEVGWQVIAQWTMQSLVLQSECMLSMYPYHAVEYQWSTCYQEGSNMSPESTSSCIGKELVQWTNWGSSESFKDEKEWRKDCFSQLIGEQPESHVYRSDSGQWVMDFQENWKIEPVAFLHMNRSTNPVIIFPEFRRMKIVAVMDLDERSTHHSA